MRTIWKVLWLFSGLYFGTVDSVTPQEFCAGTVPGADTKYYSPVSKTCFVEFSKSEEQAIAKAACVAVGGKGLVGRLAVVDHEALRLDLVNSPINFEEVWIGLEWNGTHTDPWQDSVFWLDWDGSKIAALDSSWTLPMGFNEQSIDRICTYTRYNGDQYYFRDCTSTEDYLCEITFFLTIYFYLQVYLFKDHHTTL